MAADILGAGVLGVATILALGGLLALGATYLPRLLKWEELGANARWGIQGAPGPMEPTEPVLSSEGEKPAPVLPPREPLADRLGAAGEEPLVAAAIALALSLYQQEPRPVLQGETALRGGSPWALSGRWQAMQARINRQQKR